jgi:hypothetical protein
VGGDADGVRIEIGGDAAAAEGMAMPERARGSRPEPALLNHVAGAAAPPL